MKFPELDKELNSFLSSQTKAEPKWTCCQLIRAVDTTVATKIDRHTLHNPSVMESLGSSEPDWCYAYRFPIDCPFGRRQEPRCPEDLHPKNVGTEENPCWACCGTPDESNAVTNLGKSSLADPKQTSLSHDETCAAVQFPRHCPFGRQSHTPVCPDGWNAKNAGEDGDYCWTCCHGVNEQKITQDDPDDEPEDQCLPWAFPFHCPLGTQDEEPECFDGWYAEDMGFGDYPCWTCCPEEEPVTPEKALESTVKETCVTVDFPMRCPFGHQSREPQCPKKWYPKNVGVSRNYCWTCCQESEDETSLELL